LSKTVFFDFGGALIKTPDYRWISKWKNLMGLNDHPEVLALIENPHDAPLIKDICLGKVPENHIWSVMAEKWHVKPELIAYFRHQVSSKRHFNRQMVRLLGGLLENYQTAILSNAGDQSRRLMEEVLHLHHYVDAIIISAEEGFIKPDPKILEIAMQRLNANPETSLLIDDHLPKIWAARAFGMRAVQFINTHQATRMLQHALDGRS
jgi:HAD superfamily hydrolase (TIGR01509 family)